MELSSPFVYTLCQAGAERALKRELARSQPGWVAAYQRPGLVTFRLETAAPPELALTSVFARQHGLSLGLCDGLDALVGRLRALPTPLCLHMVERAPSDPDDSAPADYARELEQTLRVRCADRVSPSSEARVGQLVATVIVAPGEAPLLGLHRHDRTRSPFAGGRYPIPLPPAAPSRAYLKIEEAIRTFRLPLRAGDTALEIGAAPGGAAYALVQRGVSVLAVDPAAMDEKLLALTGPSAARVTHLRMPVAELKREQLHAPIDWLLLDVHLAPQVALRAASRLASQHKATLQGAVLTLKLNDWSFAESIPAFLRQAGEMGLVTVHAKQLASHRQELALVGLTKRGSRRV